MSLLLLFAANHVQADPATLKWDLAGQVNGSALTLKSDLRSEVSGTASSLKWDLFTQVGLVNPASLSGRVLDLSPDGFTSLYDELIFDAGYSASWPVVAGDYLYWIVYGSVDRALLDGTGVVPLVIDAAISPGNCQMTVAGGYLFVTDYMTGRIGRANLDGTGFDWDFITGLPANENASPFALATDGTYLYWFPWTGDTVGRALLNGSGADNEWASGISSEQIKDACCGGGYLYWAQANYNEGGSQTGGIGRIAVDGTGATPLFVDLTIGQEAPYAVAVDATHIWWTVWSFGDAKWALGRCLLNGTSVEPRFLPELGRDPGEARYGLAISGGYAYTPQWNSARMERRLLVEGTLGALWTDASGTATVVADPGRTPRYDPSANGGRGAIVYEPVAYGDDPGWSISGVQPLAWTEGWTVLWAIKPSALPDANYGNVLASGSEVGFWMHGGKLDGYFAGDRQTSQSVVDAPHVLAARTDAGDPEHMAMWVDGELGYEADFATTFTPTGLGCDGGNGGEGFAGEMYRVLAFDRALTDAELAGVTEWLAEECAVESATTGMTLRWDTVAEVASTETLKWALYAEAASEVSLLWDTRVGVDASASALLWDLRAEVDAAALRALWDLWAMVAPALGVKWDLRAETSAAALRALWDLRLAVSSAALRLPYDLRAEVDRALSVLWDLRAAIAAALGLKWDVRAQVNAAAIAALWNLRAEANATALRLIADLRAQIAASGVGFKWDLRAQATAAAIRALWDLRAETDALALALVWDLAGTVYPVDADALALMWDVIAQTSATATFEWNVRNPVAASEIMVPWDLFASVAVTLSVFWDVYGEMTAVAAGLKWDLRALANGSPLGLVWALRGRVNSAALYLVWTLLALARRHVSATVSERDVTAMVGMGAVSATVDGRETVTTVGVGGPTAIVSEDEESAELVMLP
jgi:hypothetical protein